jgi:superfamily I DNA and/or RNA helicase
MHKDIMSFSNLKFYNNALEAHESVAMRGIGGLFPSVEFIDTAGCGYAEQESEENSSRSNPEEAHLLMRHFNQLKLDLSDRSSIGVISPYRGQIDILSELFNEEKMVTVNTIDSFQGQERDVIYLSLVRSNDRSEIGFLKDYRRMNVAMTRARMKLVVIGDSATLGNDSFYSDFLDFAEKLGAYRTAWEFME